MRQRISQFDSGKLTEAVATPTCSSCCCCCCCLTTAAASSSILTKRILVETKNNKSSFRGLLVTASALFVPLSLALGYFGYWTINTVFGSCETRTYTYSSLLRDEPTTYQACTEPAARLILPIIVLSPFLILGFLYTKAKIPHPWRRAFFAMLLISLGFVIEFFVGASLILSSAGLGYLIAIPFLWIFAHKLYSRSRLSKPLSN